MEKLKRKITGQVVSNKAQKTLIVEVVSVKVHPKYKKRYQTQKRFAVHVAEGEYGVGDKVEIQECAPKSKTKRWEVVRKV